MIEVTSKKTTFTYNVYHLVKAFYPDEEIIQKVEEEQVPLVALRLPGGACFSLTEEELMHREPGLRLCRERTDAGKEIQNSAFQSVVEGISGKNGGMQKNEGAQRDEGDRRNKAARTGEGGQISEGGHSVASAQTGEGDKRDEGAKAQKRALTRWVYRLLSEQTGRSLAWGMLTGVRPTKLVMQKIEAGWDRDGILSFLEEEYFVSRAKADLAYEIACRENAILSRLDCEKGFSLYIGIPFCPSVCSYCSFSSSPIDAWRGRTEAYLDALIQEIRALPRMMQGRRPDTVYIGGGTPTTLEADQLERLLSVVAECFDLEHLLEFTVEAGRPDSITREKLEVIRKYPVTRISINPQTMQQKTLDIVGRRHTVEEVTDAFRMARELGFDNINMDLIAGLPGECAADMRDTLRQIGELHPDSLTVHSLAIKRAARLGQEKKQVDRREAIRTEQQGNRPAEHTEGSSPAPLGENQVDYCGEISRMVEDAAACAKRLDLEPYYLYRQKNIAGNFENVGYAKVDKAGIYNILIMEEKQTIVACGAGASTKIVLPRKIRTENGKETNLIRIENVKSITEYINRIDEMIERKGEWLWH